MTSSTETSTTETSSVAALSLTAKGPLKRWRLKWVWCLVLLPFPVIWSGYWAWNSLQTRQFRQKCNTAKRSEDWRTERDVAKKWIAWSPNANEAWWFAAEAAQELEDPEDIAFCLGHITSDDPKSLFAYVEKANLEWTVLNRPFDAVATSKRVLAADARVIEIQSRLVSFYAMSLQRSEMLKAIRSAILAQGEPREAYAYMMLADNLAFSNGADLNSRWLASSPDEVRFKIGLAVNTAGSIARNADVSTSGNVVELEREAERQLRWFLDSVPHDPVLLAYLMHRAYEAGDAQRVGELLQNVDDTGAEDHMIWVYRGWYHVQMQELSQAEEALREALRLNPLSGLARHEYAQLMRLRQQPATAVAQQQKLAAAAKEIRSQIQLQPNARDIPWELFEKIAHYAAECGDTQIAEALARRSGTLSAPSPMPPPLSLGQRNPLAADAVATEGKAPAEPRISNQPR